VREVINQITTLVTFTLVLLLYSGFSAYGQVYGCIDSAANNYDSTATIDDGSCDYGLEGCLDTSAGNFNPLAQVDPGDLCLYGDYLIEIERHYAHDGTVQDYPEGFHTYRIYVVGDDPLDLLQSVYCDQNTTSPGYITTDGSGEFWNNLSAGITAQELNPVLFETQPAAVYDSFITIGMENSLDNGFFLADAGIPNNAFDWSLLDGNQDLEMESGIWITIPDFDNGFLGNDQKVLIAQITTSAALTGRLSFNIKPAIDPTVAYSFVDVDFRGDEFAACTDPLAINYESDTEGWSDDCIYGDYYLEVEPFYDDNQTIDGYPINHSTYRIWAHLDGADDAITQIYSMYNLDPLQFESNGEIWNSPNGGVEGADLDPNDFDQYPAAVYDSFITIGIESNEGEGTSILHYDVEPDNAFQNSFGFQSDQLNLIQGGWICEEGATNTLANQDGKVLLAQITTDGQISGQLNIHVIREDGSTFEWVGAQFEGPQPPGCTDSTALNFDENATMEDGSCDYAPCTLEEMMIDWCLWDSELEMWVPGLYLTPLYSGICDNWLISIVDLADPTNNWTITSADMVLPPSGSTTLIIEEALISCNAYSIQGSVGSHTFENVFYAATCGQISGCTNPSAINYNSEAECDDESCEFEPCSIENMDVSWLCEMQSDSLIEGFLIEVTWLGYCSFTSMHITDDSGTIDEWIYDLPNDLTSGEPWILPFESAGDLILNIATYAPKLVALNSVQIDICISGCTDSAALNYNPEAVVDDGSCVMEDCLENEVTLGLNVLFFGNEIGWSLTNMNEEPLYQGSSYPDNSFWTDTLCLPNGCYIFNLNDQFGDGWNGTTYMLDYAGGSSYTGTLQTGYSTMDIVSINSNCPIDGCMNPAASNYNPLATISDGNCIFQSIEFSDSGHANGDFIGSIDQTAGNELEFDLQNLESGERYHIRVFNSLGRLVIDAVYDAETPSPHIVLPIPGKAAGVYYLTVESPYGRQSRQFIKF
jgi:hypothetical protein